jgi:hypothetical protein
MSEKDQQIAAKPLNRLRSTGAILQGVLLGLLLVPALMQLALLANDISPFKYQGF